MNDELNALVKAVAEAHDKLQLAEDAFSKADTLVRHSKRNLAGCEHNLNKYTHRLVRAERQHVSDIETVLENIYNV